MPLSKRYFVLIITLLVILTLVFGTRKEGKDTPIGPKEWLFEFQTESVKPVPKKEAPIPYVIEGYYSAFEKRMEYDGEFYGTTTCDTLIVTKEDNPLVQNMLELIRNGNTINRMTNDGRLRLKINLDELNLETRDSIKNSSSTNPINIEMKLREVHGKEDIGCGSFVEILEVK